MHPHPRPGQRLLLTYTVLLCALGAILLVALPRERAGIACMLAASLAAGWVVAILSIRRMRREVRKLRTAAEAVQRGESIDTGEENDFTKLGETMRRLTEQLQQTVRDHEQLQRRLTRSEKLAIIGELAATVAHEINNPLDGLQNCTRIIREHPDNLEQTRRLLELMDSGLYRIEMIVRRLLTMARDEPVRPLPTPLDEIIEDAVAFLQPRLERAGIRLQRSLPGEPVVALADPPQMVQVLINLMVNAADAMPSGGVLTLSVARNSSEGGAVLEVGDTGAGIDGKHLPHIFEPFYTTKSQGAGTGLGLSVVARIVEAHGGRIGVQSTPGRGTIFRIELPVPPPAAVHPKTADAVTTG